ncbi:EAL domain-containing protein [Tumidithrix helvetica]|uniref:EAL domain-containing protein n=1 Tax=Tumidithrix helvetica TaxID=3457545 RepID=UPI003CC667DE
MPTVVLLVISYFQSIANAKTNLEGIIKVATQKTDLLLDNAEVMMRRSNIDLQNADSQTAINILQRQIYNDFRFREFGIVNPEGLLTLSSLGATNPPVTISPTKYRFEPSDLNLQILGLGRTQLMQEQSIVLMLKGSGRIGSMYLLVDPIILTNFLEAIPDLDLGSNGYIAYMTSDRRILSAIGSPSPDMVSALQNQSFNTIQVINTTKDGRIAIVGEIDRQWALRYWMQEFLVGAPLTLLISGILSYLFIRQVRLFNTLDYELKRGLALNEFEVYYQPIIDLKTAKCVGSEALMRWRHPQRGLIYPGLFIPIAEQTGLIVPMTEWLLRKVIQDRAILETKFQDLYISLNLSPSHLNTGDVERLIQILRESDRAHAKITFEITENRLVEQQGQVVQDVIARIKQWGIRFAIDDFGTGYSNIAYLQRLDIDQLKLDQLFTKGLEHGNKISQIVDSLIDFGDRLGLTIVAEGIETETQYQYLKDRGVSYGQGWLFARAMPFEDFERFLQAQDR